MAGLAGRRGRGDSAGTDRDYVLNVLEAHRPVKVRRENEVLSFKVVALGASSGMILTKEAMARLRVKEGDTLYLTEAPDGGYRLAPYDPDFERRMRLAEDIMHDDGEVLQALAR